MKKVTLPSSMVFALAPKLAWAQTSSGPENYQWGPGMMGWGGGWSGMIFGPIFMIVMLALIIAIAVLLVRWIGGTSQGGAPYQPAPPARTSLDILKKRYANGDIDTEEFEARRRTLGE